MTQQDQYKLYTVPTGSLKGVKYTMLSFRPAIADLESMELERTEPQFLYVHPDGRKQVQEPDDLKAERARVEKQRERLYEQAAKLNREPNPDKLANLKAETQWERKRTWGLLHDTFFICLPVLIDVDASDVVSPSAELRAFLHIWQQNDAPLLERWRLFRQLLGVQVTNTLWDAYTATRDVDGAAPPEQGQATPPENPLDGTDGSE